MKCKHTLRVGLLLAISGCSDGASDTAALLRTDRLGDVIERLVKGPTRTQVQGVSALSVTQYYRSLVATTNNSPVLLGGHLVRGVHDEMVAAEPVFQAIAKKYQTIGEFFRASTLGQASTSSKAQITAAYTQVAKDFSAKSGWFKRSSLRLQEAALTDEPSLQVRVQDQGLHHIAALATLALANRQPEASLGLITNGAATCNFPSVVRISMMVGKKKHYCTGTFINRTKDSSTLQTASHCLQNAESVTLLKGPNSQQAVTASSFRRSTGYDSAYSPDYDAGEVIFPIAAPAVSAFATTPPKVGDQITLAGYGQTDAYDYKSAGNLNCGTNTIQETSLTNGSFTFFGLTGGSTSEPKGTQVMTTHGDSGGPAFNTQGEIVGWTSGGPNAATGDDTNATSDASKEFFKP